MMNSSRTANVGSTAAMVAVTLRSRTSCRGIRDHRVQSTTSAVTTNIGALYAARQWCNLVIGGKTPLRPREELDAGWDPGQDARRTIWEVTQHLIRVLEAKGEAAVVERFFEEAARRMTVILHGPARRLAAVVRERNFYRAGETPDRNTTHYGQPVVDNHLPELWRQLVTNSAHDARRREIARWNAAHPHAKRGLAITPVKFGISFTASWLNQVERFFADMTEKRLRRGVFKSVPALETAIDEYLAAHNENSKPFKWVADAEAIYSYEVTREMNTLIVGRNLTGRSAFV